MKRISFGSPAFEGNNNAYVFDDGDAVALVDTGPADPGSRRRLREGLARHGYGFEDVDAVLITHHHEDHAELVGYVQERSDATVYAHEADADLVAGDPDAHDAMTRLRRRRLDEWNVPEGKVEELLTAIHYHELTDRAPATVEPIEDGDVVAVGDRELTAVHAPGHAGGMCCFEFETDGGVEVFSGDAVLPKYTPNVGGADVRVERPLEKYLATLDRFASRDYDRAWPGHRDVIDDPTARAEAIIAHHEERTERVVGILREHGPADAWTVSAHLFGELESIHILHGPGEAFAHLDHLRHHGIVAADGREYELVEETPDLDGLFATAA